MTPTVFESLIPVLNPIPDLGIIMKNTLFGIPTILMPVGTVTGSLYLFHTLNDTGVKKSYPAEPDVALFGSLISSQYL